MQTRKKLPPKNHARKTAEELLSEARQWAWRESGLQDVAKQGGLKAAARGLQYFRALAREHRERDVQAEELAALEAAIGGCEALLATNQRISVPERGKRTYGQRIPRLAVQQARALLETLQPHRDWLAPLVTQKRQGRHGADARTVLVIELRGTNEQATAASILAGLLTEADIKAHKAETLAQVIRIERERVRKARERLGVAPQNEPE